MQFDKGASKEAGSAVQKKERGSQGDGVQLKGKSLGEQQAELAPGAPVQMHGGGGEGVHAAAAHGISGNSGSLPHGDAIQKSFGHHDVSNVQAHVGGAAAEATASMGATAFATGSHVAFGSSPDLHTAAHEAAHVVQQRGGVQLKGGVGQVGDRYEQHADQVADLVVQGKSAEGLLDKMSGPTPAVQNKAIQAKGPIQFDNGGLTQMDRLRLESEIGDRIGIAFTKYVDACNDHKEAMKAAAKAQEDMIMLFADIALAFVLPGAGKALGALINKVPINAPDTVVKAAILGLDHTDAIVGGVTSVAKDKAKAGLGSVLRMTEDEAFVEKLKENFSQAAESVRANLPNQTDAQLMVTCAAYSASVATKANYAKRIATAVAGFKAQVKPIGKYRSASTFSQHVGKTGTVARIDGKLALVDKVNTSSGAWMSSEVPSISTTYDFRTWISPEFQEMAIKAQGGEKKVITLTKGEVYGLGKTRPKKDGGYGSGYGSGTGGGQRSGGGGGGSGY